MKTLIKKLENIKDMCGITFIFSKYARANVLLDGLTHRGPDAHTELQTSVGRFLFDRLSINGIHDGGQPFNENETAIICNGEIYNHKELAKFLNVEPQTGSDCEILYLMLKDRFFHLEDVFRMLDAEFACVFQGPDQEIVVARDPLGVRPLFIAHADKHIVGFSSEAKGLTEIPEVTRIKQFPPGCYWSSKSPETFENYNALTLFKTSVVDPKPAVDEHVENVRNLLVEAVRKRVQMTDRSVAFFLSGGLDSSIIAAIGASLSPSDKPITTYSIGVGGGDSPDLNAARIVANHLGAKHVIVEIDPVLASERVEEVIRQLESYDCTTVRASVPMYLLSEYISKNTDDVVILSGEGADELFGGYLYFHDAPTNDAFQKETIRLLREIHQYDGLRADRCTAAHGLELRVPFLDKALVEYVTTRICPELKHPRTNGGVEKAILRRAFTHLLPDEIVNRQKNGMSDAVGYSWVDFLRSIATEKVVVQDSNEYLVNPPLTKEELWYREVFESAYHDRVTSHTGIWRPRWAPEGLTDPSARLLNCFKK